MIYLTPFLFLLYYLFSIGINQYNLFLPIIYEKLLPYSCKLYLFPFKLSSANSRVVSFLNKNNICMQNNKNIPNDPDKDKKTAKIISKGL